MKCSSDGTRTDCSMQQSNTTHHPPAAPNVTHPPHHTKAQSCSTDWVDFASSLLPRQTVMTDGAQSHGLNELNRHLIQMAHRLREWYLCVYIKRQKKWWWLIGNVSESVNGIEKGVDIVPVSVGIKLIFFLVAGTVLCFGFSVRILLITRWWFSCC